MKRIKQGFGAHKLLLLKFEIHPAIRFVFFTDTEVKNTRSDILVIVYVYGILHLLRANVNF